jgi:hypothetical protein
MKAPTETKEVRPQCPEIVKWSPDGNTAYYCLLDFDHEGPCECMEEDLREQVDETMAEMLRPEAKGESQ